MEVETELMNAKTHMDENIPIRMGLGMHTGYRIRKDGWMG